MENKTAIFTAYEKCKSWSETTGYYNKVNKNTRYWDGNQWQGLEAKDLPQPVFNIVKPIGMYEIAALLSKNIGVAVTPFFQEDESENEELNNEQEVADILTGEFNNQWDQDKMLVKIRQSLLDAEIAGDAYMYLYWDAKKYNGQRPLGNTGIKEEGDVEVETVDGVNVHFGNPNEQSVEKQPFILVCFRDTVVRLREEAKSNGASAEEIELITSDSDNQEQQGRFGKEEMSEADKALAILKLWRAEDGFIYGEKVTKTATIRKKWNLGIKVYPIAKMNYEQVKNNYRGHSKFEDVIPNQNYINKMFAIVMVMYLLHSSPRLMIDKSRIASFTNKIGSAIMVDSFEGGDPVRVLQQTPFTGGIIDSIQYALNTTLQLLGYNDAARGNINPDNASAVAMVTEQASIPLENVRANLYQYIEDIALIRSEFMISNYGVRQVQTTLMGKKVVKEVDFTQLRDKKYKFKIDVGPSSYHSEENTVQTLNNLLDRQLIDFTDYLDRLPQGYIPKKSELITKIKDTNIKDKALWILIEPIYTALSPDERKQIESLNPSEFESEMLKRVMAQQEQQQSQQPTNVPQQVMPNQLV